MIIKPKTVMVMANMLGRARREATFIFFQGLFLLRTFSASYTGSALEKNLFFFLIAKYKGRHIGHIFFLFS